MVGTGAHQAGPGCFACGAGAGEGGDEEACVVVDDVEHPGRLAVGEPGLGRVNLPQVVGAIALKAFPGLARSGRLGCDQVVALQRLMDRRHRRWGDAGTGKLGTDAAGAPTGMVPSQVHDLQLARRLDPARRAARPARARRQTVRSFLQEPLPVAVEARPRDPSPPTHLRHRFARLRGLQQQLQLQLLHRHHLQRHAGLPYRSLHGRKAGSRSTTAVSQISPDCLTRLRNDPSQINPVKTTASASPRMVSFGEYSWRRMGNPAPFSRPNTAQPSPLVTSSPHLRTVHTREVAGSIPAAPIAQPSRFRALSGGAARVNGERNGEYSGVDGSWRSGQLRVMQKAWLGRERLAGLKRSTLEPSTPG